MSDQTEATLAVADHTLQVSLEHITPQDASTYLELNASNRRLKPRAVDSIAESIRDGDWRLNGQTIVFDTNGELADGQHRLSAIARTGIPVVSLVVRGVQPLEAQDTQDIGVKRSVADQLTRHGFQKTKDLASILTGLEVLRGCRDWQTHNKMPLTTPRALRMMESFPDYVEVIDLAGRCRRATGLPVSAAGALFVLFREVDQADAEEFFRLLMSGEGLASDSPILLLRNRLLAEATNPHPGGAMPTRLRAALTIKAWSAWRRGQPLGVLRWRTGGAKPEPFPAWDEEVAA